MDSDDIVFEEEPAVDIENNNKKGFQTFSNDLNIRHCHEREIK